jgi:hypothetical protein
VIFAAAALAACGGEKDGKSVPDVTVAYTGGSMAMVTIESEAQVGELALGARDASKAVSGGASSFVSLAGVVKAPAFGVKQAMERVAAARREAGASLAGVVEGVTFSLTLPCESAGTVTMTLVDQDGTSSTTGIGDYTELTFSNCWSADGSAMDGSFRLTATTAGGDWTDPALVSEYSTFGFNLTFENLLVVAGGRYAGLDGEIGFAYTVDPASNLMRYEMFGQEIVGIEGDASSGAIWDAFLLQGLDAADYTDVLVEHFADESFLQLSSIEYGFSGEVCSFGLGGCLQIETYPLFLQDADEPYPYDGLFWISDGAAEVQIEPYDGVYGKIWVSFDIGGSFGPYDTTWSCLENHTDSSACFTD